MPRDHAKFCAKRGFVIIATEFPGDGFEPFDLRQAVQGVGLFVSGAGFAGWHGDSLGILWTV